MRSQSSLVLAVCVAAVLSTSPEAHAQAAGLNVSPIQIYLTPASRNTLLTVRNDGAEEGRYQLDVFEWSESEKGEMKLKPTKEVVFFPRLLVLKPGEQRNVRVGAMAEAPSEEKSYRIFVEELPPPRKADAGMGVRVLTKIGLPIFLTPEKASPAPKIHDLKIQGGKALFRVKNEGTKHFQVEKLKISGRDAKSASAFETSMSGWYVLRNQDRMYEVSIPKDACPKVKELQVDAVMASGTVTAKQAVSVSAGSCSG